MDKIRYIIIIFLLIATQAMAATLAAPVYTSATLDTGLEFNDEGTIVRHKCYLPDEVNMGSPVKLYTAANLGDFYPHIQRLPSGVYRFYYTWWKTDSKDYLYYRDTSDTGFPSTANIGSATFLKGTGANDEWETAFIIWNPVTSTYRMYFGHSSGPSEAYYWQVNYCDTTDANLPNASNLSAKVHIAYDGDGAPGDGNTVPIIWRKPDLTYRIYTLKIRSGAQCSIVYRDTTNTNLPDNTNLGSETTLIVASYAQVIHIERNADQSYRVYYSTGTNDWVRSLRYIDTTDTNLPSSSNISSTTSGSVALGIGGGGGTYGETNGIAQGFEILKLDNGKWVFYYCTNKGNVGSEYPYSLYYIEQTTDAITSPLVADPVYLVDSSSASTTWVFSADSINENPSGYSGTILYQWSVDNGVRSWNGSWLTKAQLASVSNQVGRYKAIKAQFTSAGAQMAALGESSFDYGYESPPSIVNSSSRGSGLRMN